MAEKMSPKPLAVSGAVSLADPVPIGLTGFAITLFMMGVWMQGWGPGFVWMTLALFYGGASTFIAGMLAYPRDDVFSATVFTVYGAFWMGLALIFLTVLSKAGPLFTTASSPWEQLGWFFLLIFIFNTFMLVCSLLVNVAVTAVFFLLELTWLCLFIGGLSLQEAGAKGTWTIAGGYFAFFTSVLALFVAFAYLWNDIAGFSMLPLGKPLLNFSGASHSAAPAMEHTDLPDGHPEVPVTEAPVIVET